jgi:hypothetical protein
LDYPTDAIQQTFNHPGFQIRGGDGVTSGTDAPFSEIPTNPLARFILGEELRGRSEISHVLQSRAWMARSGLRCDRDYSFLV